MRVISGLVLAVLTFLGVWYLPTNLFAALIIAVSLLALWEFLQMFFQRRFNLLAELCCIALATLLVEGYAEYVAPFFVLTLFVIGLSVMKRASTVTNIAEHYALQILGISYASFTLPFWALLHQLEFGRVWVLLGIAAAALSDTFALVVGKTWGKTPFSPMISPKKTWAGFVGALLGSFAGASLIWYVGLQAHVAFIHIFFLGLIIWITGVFGDLLESMLKRSAGVKDSGKVIPGHGGILDRLDALIFTGPALYWYVTTFVQ